MRPGTAVRISTGAAVPPGASAVIPVERTRASDSRVQVEETAEGANIRRAGEDVRAGDVVLERGMRLGPAELGVAASVGRAELLCSRTPRVALLVTGTSWSRPGCRSTRDGSTPRTATRSPRRCSAPAAARRLGDGARLGRGHARRDRRRARRRRHGHRLRRSVGGAPRPREERSARAGCRGAFLGRLPAARQAHLVRDAPECARLRPAREPGFRDGDLSALRPPRPRRLAGADPAARASALLDEPVPRHQRREQAVRVRLRHAEDGLRAVPTGEQGSHILTSMVGADGLALIAAGEGEAPAGQRVEVELL